MGSRGDTPLVDGAFAHASPAHWLLITASLPGEAEASEVCEASWHGPGFYGNYTASGTIYTGEAGTAAHPWLPFGTVVGVTNLNDGIYTELVITDRGPYAYSRCLDVSAGSSWIVDYSVAPVSVEVLYYPY